MVYDCIIIGAGISGLAAAITLSNAGHDVLVLEKSSGPPQKVCAGGITNRAQRWFQQVGITLPTGNQVFGVEYNYHPDYQTILSTRTSYTSVIPRWKLDTHVYAQIKERNINIQFNQCVRSLRYANETFHIHTDHQSYECKHCIAADGTPSLARRTFLAAKSSQTAHPFCPSLMISSLKSPFQLPNRIIFDFGVTPHGYAWIFPYDHHHANCGIYSFRQASRRELQESLMPYLAEKFHIRSKPDGIRGGMLGTGGFNPKLLNAPILLAGDAALLVDPLSGEGIPQAIESGVLAANAVISHTADALQAATRYYKAITALLQDTRTATKLSLLFPNRLRTIMRLMQSPLLHKPLAQAYLDGYAFRKMLLLSPYLLIKSFMQKSVRRQAANTPGKQHAAK